VTRERLLDRLDGASVDLLVIGAGIVGSRVAYEAAHAGLRVALVDAGDFGGATSSASSKLVHGGLRYLATGDVRLVRQLHTERLALMTRVAPHLVRPLPLLLAVEREHARRSAKLVAALALYGGIASSRQAMPRLVRPSRTRALVPALDPSAVALCGVVPEAQTHDARLTLATVRGAASAGAAALNYVRLVEWKHSRGAVVGATLRDVHGDRELDVRCRAAVNATGPWVDRVRRLDRPAAPPLARLSKGVHAVVPLEEPWAAGVALFDEGRTALAVPWQGMLLVGASDTEFDGDPGDVRATRADVAAVLEPISRVVAIDATPVVHAFAGLRVLPRGPGDTARASREHLVEVAPSGLVSIAGGKLTTHRAIAADVLRRLPWSLPTTDAPLPGAGRTTLAGVDPEVAQHLAGLYGSDAGCVIAYPGALERVHGGGPDVLGQVLFARDEEWALTVDDVVHRRTTLAVRGLAGEDVRERIASVLGVAPPLAVAS
jgi:glycerol-3-phosphate dehydrogenase